MKTKIKYEKFQGEEVGWFQKNSPKIVSRSRSPIPIAASKKQIGQVKLEKSKSETNLAKSSEDFTYREYLRDKNAKIISLLENRK